MVLEILCVEPIYPQYSGVIETCLALRSDIGFLRCLAAKVFKYCVLRNIYLVCHAFSLLIDIACCHWLWMDLGSNLFGNPHRIATRAVQI